MITHPEKVLFPADEGHHQGRARRLLRAIAPLMLPHLRARPVTMERYPAGIDKKGFIQKDVSKGFPDWLERVEVPKKDGTVHHPLVTDARSLLWSSTRTPSRRTSGRRARRDLLSPRRLRLRSRSAGRRAGRAARAPRCALRDLLAELGLPSWVKTSGSKGFHIVVPLDGNVADGRGGAASRTPSARCW